jgi:hypothetical protein
MLNRLGLFCTYFYIPTNLLNRVVKRAFYSQLCYSHTNCVQKSFFCINCVPGFLNKYMNYAPKQKHYFASHFIQTWESQSQIIFNSRSKILVFFRCYAIKSMSIKLYWKITWLKKTWRYLFNKIETS